MHFSFRSGTDSITYRFTTCDRSGQYGPTLDDCSRHYERTGSPTASVLHYPEPASSRIQGVQYFKVPATDWYTVTASGGRGGRGVCTRWPGLSPIVQIERVFLQKGTVLEVSVGHQGTDACSNNPHSVYLCQLNITTIAEAVSCSSQWQNISNSSHLAPLYDSPPQKGAVLVPCLLWMFCCVRLCSCSVVHWSSCSYSI